MSIVDQGQIRGSFKGFGSAGTTFELTSGRKWCQIETKIIIYNFFMPSAKVVQESGGYRLYVDGMRDSVLVRPA